MSRVDLRYLGVGLSGGMAAGAVLGALLGTWWIVAAVVAGDGFTADLIFLPLFGIVLGGLGGALPGLVAGLACALLVPRLEGQDLRSRGRAAGMLGAGGAFVGVVGLAAALAAAGSGLQVGWPGIVLCGLVAAVPVGWLMARSTRSLHHS
ncbi:hypothetical protein [Serinicoccus sp. LYQ131]|uniref:hypothetical protein n=1 Tax=Serinicoccus sp. LYQ131 TaxID=3378797 RepID=UPI003852D432